MNSKRIISLAAPLLIATAVAAPAQATIAGPVSSVKSRTLSEPAAVKFTGKGNCPTFTSCLYRISAESGTAILGTDFTAPARKKRVSRTNVQRPMQLVVRTIDDGVCEPNETFKVTLVGTGAEDDDSFVAEATGTIVDTADCAAQPAPVTPAPVTPPATPPAQPAPTQPAPTTPAPSTPAPTTPPADSGTPEETTQTMTNGFVKSCRTPYWTGQKDVPNGGQGYYYNSGCTVTATCPTSYSVCTVQGEGANNSEFNRDERVTLNSRLRAFSASMTQFWFRDQSCASTAWCRTEDTIHIRGGETISNQCNGLRQTVPQANRTAVRCTITLEKLY